MLDEQDRGTYKRKKLLHKVISILTSIPYLIANSFIFYSDLMNYLKHTK